MMERGGLQMACVGYALAPGTILRSVRIMGNRALLMKKSSSSLRAVRNQIGDKKVGCVCKK